MMKMNYGWPMKKSITLMIVMLLLGCRLAPAQTNETANTVTIDVNGLINAAQAWAQDNLDDDVLRALQGVDRAQVADFLKRYQDYLKGDYVLDLAQLKEAMTTVLPLLEAHEETQPYAAWLRSRMDYFEAAQEMQAAAAAPVPVPGTNAPPP